MPRSKTSNVEVLAYEESSLGVVCLRRRELLSMPGTVTSHNADEVLADGSLRWELPLLGGTTELHAESEFGGSGFPWLFVIIALVVVIGIAALVGAITMSSRKEKQAVSAAAVASQDAPTPEADLPDADTDLTADE